VTALAAPIAAQRVRNFPDDATTPPLFTGDHNKIQKLVARSWSSAAAGDPPRAEYFEVITYVVEVTDDGVAVGADGD